MRFDRTSFNNENKQIDKGKPEKGINEPKPYFNLKKARFVDKVKSTIWGGGNSTIHPL